MIVRLLTLFFTLVWIASPADAHDWYDGDCCSDRDCHPVADGIVIDTQDGGVDVKGFIQSGGFIQHLAPSSTRLRWSLDTRDHICNDAEKLICVYRVRRSY